MPRIGPGFVLVAMLTAAPASADCLPKLLACETTIDGELKPGDCPNSADKSPYDRYRFSGTAGELVDVTIAPLDRSLTRPYVTLDPPPGDISVPPFIGGGGTPRFRFVLTSSGVWTIRVGTLAPLDTGRYRLALHCQAIPTVDAQGLCTIQPFSCGQVAHWMVAPASCKFGNHGAYADYRVTAEGNVPFNFRVHSDAFDPVVALYTITGVFSLVRGVGRRFTTDAYLTYLPFGGLYDIAAYSADDDQFGEFTLYGDCAAPPVCVPPLITVPPQSRTIPPGGSVVLSAIASGNEPLTYTWHISYGTVTFGNEPTLVVHGVTQTTLYTVEVTNPCGTTTGSAMITVQPPRERSVRH
jgi:hypothetical protein